MYSIWEIHRWRKGGDSISEDYGFESSWLQVIHQFALVIGILQNG